MAFARICLLLSALGLAGPALARAAASGAGATATSPVATATSSATTATSSARAATSSARAASASAGVATGAAPAEASRRAPTDTVAVLDAAGRSLLDTHVSAAQGGWAWRSVIQAPHLQTDRDVGAASVLNGLLALYQQSGEASYLDGARRAGDWLLAVAETSGPGLRWADWVDSSAGRSSVHYTSFDDGTPGIAEVLWRLGQVTGDPRYTQAAMAGMRWVAWRAQSVGSAACPSAMCRWSWRDGTPGDYETGLGEGQAGIVYAFLAFAQRTGQRAWLSYARAGGAYLESLMGSDGAIPERAGAAGVDAGYLSGMAGQAYVFLALYRQTGEARWLADARRALGWLSAHAAHEGAGVAWPIEVDGAGGDGNSARATGMEEGAAGIGWVELQAYAVTGDRASLALARGAGDWLLAAGVGRGGGLSWPQDAGQSGAPTSLDNGAAGIGWFLADLGQATGEPGFAAGAAAAGRWLTSAAQTGSSGLQWPGRDGTIALAGDSSWHWGSAGIAAFLGRLAGGVSDAPGEEPALRGAGPAPERVALDTSLRSRRARTGALGARGALASLPQRADAARLIQIS
ncbi:MAG: hypothetical protein E6G56_07905 [Actinobacteria bacterium]|nr:MAG: hypothetical protein E6G56_07905 [Actinomycetota bacterium]